MKNYGLTLAQRMICANCGDTTKFGEIVITRYGSILFCKDCIETRNDFEKRFG